MSEQMVRTAVSAIEDKKGQDIMIINIQKISVLADFFIIAEGTNRSQLQAMSDHVSEQMQRAGYELKSSEGYNTANWILMDYSDVVIHLFDKESRGYYNLERIWRDGEFTKPAQV